MGLIWLALDGVGHPDDAPAGSPWEQDLPALRPLIDKGLALDATLGVDGLPQSGTGQACWLTGQDAVAVMGEHFGPQPGPSLQRLLQEASLPVRLTQRGLKIALANYYAPEFLVQETRRNRFGCFPYSFRAAGLTLNPPSVVPVRASLGLSYQAPWLPFQEHAKLIEDARALASASQEYDLLVADLWFSDLIGHEGAIPMPSNAQKAAFEWLNRLDIWVAILLDLGVPFVLSSDHGNMEDLTIKTHTKARVPFAWSEGVFNSVGDDNILNVVHGGQEIMNLF